MTSGEYPLDERIRLVLADDDQHLLELERSFFPPNDFQVVLAHNGCEAYNQVKTLAPAVVFLDLFMPLISGEECCRLIKSDPRLRDTRVVMVTPDEEQLLRCCRDAPCDLVLTKPVRRRSFVGAVEALVGTPRRVPARWPARLAAELYTEQGCQLRTWSVNLSDKGVFLESTEMPPIGATYTLHLRISDTEVLALPAQVVWHNSGAARRDPGLPSGFGLQFLPLSGELRLRLRKLLGKTAEVNEAEPWAPGKPTCLFVELPMLTGKM